MKCLHLADLHIGKRVNGFPMLEDQHFILNEILEIAKEKEVDAVVIAGDVYDKPIPSAEAVNLFDEFLVQLTKLGLQVFAISGNHDSAERISYAGRILEESGVYLPKRFNGSIEPIRVNDSYGELNVYLIPYMHPSQVKHVFPDEKVTDYTSAMQVLLDQSNVDPNARNLAVVHQFVTYSGEEPELSDSEERHIGGLDNVDASVFAAFDYVALGHLHGPQRIGRDTVRYAGSPLKYSFSEEKQKKSVTLVEIAGKGDVTWELLPLAAERDLITLEGEFDTLMSGEFTARLSRKDYYRIILTDENDVPNALARLRTFFYENLMVLEYNNTRTATHSVINVEEDEPEKEPIEVLGELYEKQNGREMSDLQTEIAAKLIEKIWEGRA